MEPMRLHAEDVGGMGRAIYTSRPYKQAIPNSHPVPFGKTTGDSFGARTSITARALGHSLEGGVSAPQEDTRLRVAVFYGLFPWPAVLRFIHTKWRPVFGTCTVSTCSQPSRYIPKVDTRQPRKPRQPYWFRTRQERLVEKDSEGLLHDRLSCVYTYMYVDAPVKVRCFQREER